MSDRPRHSSPRPPSPMPERPGDEAGNVRDGAEGPDEPGGGRDRGLTDFFRRAMSAGFEAARSSKDDIVRVATTEIRSWLAHLDLDKELIKALSRMTLEIKAEVRFKPNPNGELKPDVDLSVKSNRERDPRDPQG